MNKCIICNNANHLPLFKGIVKCPYCNHAFVDEFLTDEDLRKLYTRKYFFGEEYSDYLADRRVIEKNFKKRIKVLNQFIQKERHQNLLEIGCAYGFFLNLVKSQFLSVKGIDINAEGVEHANQLGLESYQGDFLKYDFKERYFDVICLWDTIEHLRDPHLYLEKIDRLTQKGALIALTTGDIASLNAKLRKEKWRLIHPPTHLHYFSMESIEKLLNKNNFDIVYKHYCGFYRSIDTIIYSIFVLRKKWPRLYNLIKKTKLTSLDIYLNMLDIMYVIARKR